MDRVLARLWRNPPPSRKIQILVTGRQSACTEGGESSKNMSWEQQFTTYMSGRAMGDLLYYSFLQNQPPIAIEWQSSHLSRVYGSAVRAEFSWTVLLLVTPAITCVDALIW